MTTTMTNATTTAAALILAIDLGKYKSVACVSRRVDELAELRERQRPVVMSREPRIDAG